MSFGIPNASFRFRTSTITPTTIVNARAIVDNTVDIDPLQNKDIILYNSTQKKWITTPLSSSLDGNTFLAANGSVTAPAYSFENQPTTGTYIPANETLGFAVDEIQQLSLNTESHVLYVGPTATGSAIRFTTGGGITYIQNSEAFDKATETPTASTFQTIRFAPYLSPTSILDITQNSVVLGSSTILVATPTTVVGPTAIPVTAPIVQISTDNTANAYTLVDGTLGQQLTLLYSTEANGADSAILTPANLVGGTTITFNNVGETATLIYGTGGWFVTSLVGAVLA